MRNNKGFTFIEMLIVVAIIGILASIILVGLSGFRNRGRDTRRIADLREVQNGLELYYTKNGTYPPQNDWVTLSNNLISGGIGINVVPNDPSSGWTYCYCVSGQNYVLGAYLEDNTNPALKQNPGGTTFPCEPTVMAAPNSSPNCSTQAIPTNKYCVLF